MEKKGNSTKSLTPTLDELNTQYEYIGLQIRFENNPEHLQELARKAGSIKKQIEAQKQQALRTDILR